MSGARFDMKNKIYKYVLLLIFGVTVTIINPANSYATSEPYKTYTQSTTGYVETQAAYEPAGVLTHDLIVTPESVYVDWAGQIYVADSTSKVVVVFDSEGNYVQTIGEGILEKPLDVAVDSEGLIYVPDPIKEKVFVFNQNGELVREYGRPTSPLFGADQPYKPMKISVDARGNMYIVGEGAANGLIVMNQAGEFLGYFGANEASTSIFLQFKEWVFNKTGVTYGLMNVPTAPTAVDIDEKGIIYTVSSGLEEEAIKKLNIAGKNMISDEFLPVPMVVPEKSLVDIAVGPIGNYYVLSSEGYVFEYDAGGNLLFAFGTKETSTQRNGLFKQPTSIDVSADGTLYVADAGQGIIHILKPTEFCQTVHEGLALFQDGKYVESQIYWEEVLQMNSSFMFAHSAMGQAYFKQQMYPEALNEFELADDEEGYSEAFWEVRNEYLEEHLAYWIVGGVVLFIVWKILKFIDKKKKIFDPIRRVKSKFVAIKLVSELLLLFRILRHPIDTFYEIKRNKRASVLSATILFVIFYLEFIGSLFLTGFIFRSDLIENYSVLLISVIFLSVIFMFIVMNYLISTISDGEGSFKTVYISTVYAMAPYIIGIIPMTLLSNLLTLNEEFIYTFGMALIFMYTLICLFLMIMETQNFSFGGTVKNVFLTIFSSLVTFVVLYVIYILSNQFLNFVYSVVQEVLARV